MSSRRLWASSNAAPCRRARRTRESKSIISSLLEEEESGEGAEATRVGVGGLLV